VASVISSRSVTCVDMFALPFFCLSIMRQENGGSKNNPRQMSQNLVDGLLSSPSTKFAGTFLPSFFCLMLPRQENGGSQNNLHQKIGRASCRERVNMSSLDV